MSSCSKQTQKPHQHMLAEAREVLAPTSEKESALLVNLDPGSYSAVVRGKGNTTGIGLIEVYQMP